MRLHFLLLESDSDGEYLAAVERGDMATAQRMVDETADSVGYNKIVTHQTHKSGLKVLDRDRGHRDSVYEWDQGNVIPLSKRFDRGTPDIRY